MIKSKRMTNDQLPTPNDPKECDLDDDDFSLQDIVFDSAKQL